MSEPEDNIRPFTDEELEEHLKGKEPGAFDKLRKAILFPWRPDPPAPGGTPSQNWGVDVEHFDDMVRILSGKTPEVKQSRAEISEAANLARALIDKLTACLELGHEHAGTRLAQLAWHISVALNEVARRDPRAKEALCKVSSRSSYFPVLVGKHKSLHGPEYIQGMLDFWEVGTDTDRAQVGYKPTESMASGSPAGTLTTAQIWIDRLASMQFGSMPSMMSFEMRESQIPGWVIDACRLGSRRFDDPPMTPAESKVRFRCAWNSLMWSTDGTPEQIPELVATSAGFSANAPESGPRSDWPVERLRIEKMLQDEWRSRFSSKPVKVAPVKRSPGARRGT